MTTQNQTIGAKLFDSNRVAAAVDEKVREVLRGGGHGRVTVEVIIRNGRIELMIEKTQNKLI